MKNIIIAVFLLTANASFAQFSAKPDVRAEPDYKDTLIYNVIVYETPKNIITDVVMKNEFLKQYVSDKRSLDVKHKLRYAGPATVNEKYKDYIEVIELKLITY